MQLPGSAVYPSRMLCAPPLHGSYAWLACTVALAASHACIRMQIMVPWLMAQWEEYHTGIMM